MSIASITLFQLPQTFAQALRLAAELQEEKEMLEIALDQSLQWCTVLKYNKINNMKWDLEKCKFIGKQLTAYCKSRAIQTKKSEDDGGKYGATNSYPLAAWDDFRRLNPILF